MLKLDDAFDTILDWLHNLNIYISESDADDIAQNFYNYTLGFDLKEMETYIAVLNNWRSTYKRKNV